MAKIIVGGTNSRELAKRIAKKLNAPYSELNAKNFPDGETCLRYTFDPKGKDIVIVNSMHPEPNNSMIELIFAANTAKELGAKTVTIVAPYLAYLRQDKRFHPGECQSNKIIAKLLSCADRVITLDPHIHRIKSLKDIFKINATRLSANEAIAEYIKKKISHNATIVGPDIESYQWAEKIAEKIKMHATVLKKKRYAADVVRIKVTPGTEFKGKNVILVDDIISTGHTMIEPIRQIKKLGAKKIFCIGVHGLLVEGALKKLQTLGVKVITTNTIENPVSKIDVSGIIADALK